jgi:hypothetical protein
MLRYVIHNWERKLSRRDNNRVVRPFEWGAEFLEPHHFINHSNGNHRHPRDLIFEFNERAVSRSDEFFDLDGAPDYSLKDRWLAFQSAVKTPFVENNTVYARYFPIGPPAQEVEQARGRAVVVLPHWNAKPQEHLAMCELLNRYGIAALRLSMPYHDRRMLPGFERADYMVSANLGLTLQANRQAVLDTRAAVRWLVSRGYDRIGLVGTSLGSCVGFLTFAHEKRIKVAVYNHVSSYFGDVVWGGLTTAHVRKSLETALTGEDTRRAFLAISPNPHVGKLKGDRRRALLISARYDLSFTPELSSLLFEECDRHGLNFDRVILPCGHYTLGRVPYRYYVGYLLGSFFRKHL